MNFSTRTTYGLRAMIRLAGRKGPESLSLPNIAKAENISLGYLERLFSDLKKGGLVQSGKGVKGGYKLAKPAERIEVYEIVKSLEGKMSPFHCLDEGGKIYCKVSCRCGATKVLIKVQEAVKKTLKGIKLSDLVA
ncbi:MAG: Rrf2 family transcriptional regulator [Patescibacteria group bacterium]|nr:Rrf2 family transcriptional regulator [Patescibacteria group bacterium]